MPKEFKYDVFLSYSSKDLEDVTKLAERLKNVGLKVWFDKTASIFGRTIDKTIAEGVAASRVFMFLMSKDYLESEWTKFESVTFVFREKSGDERLFLPLTRDGVETPDWLRGYVAARYPEDTERAIAEVRKLCRPQSGASGPFDFPEDCIRPLQVAEDRYLQVLLSQFTILRRNDVERGGFELRVHFNDETPAIWDQNGKRHLYEVLREEVRNAYQERLDAFLLGSGDAARREPSYDFNGQEPPFVFRYASGGTLPIILMKENGTTKEYYCLPYRDVAPIGWNIANGGSDTREELLRPQNIIERELREELIIADFTKDERYVFAADLGKPIDHPSHAVARRLWARKFPQKDLTKLREAKIEVTWILGPDSVYADDGSGPPVRETGFFLNINGKDFGIELDRVCKIDLPGQVVLFDGEIDGGHLVNSPVGLFEVTEFNSKSGKEQANFRPDSFFFDGTRYDAAQIDHVLQYKFLPALHHFRTKGEIQKFEECIKKGEQYRLCPVTEKIVTLFVRSTRPSTALTESQR